MQEAQDPREAAARYRQGRAAAQDATGAEHAAPDGAASDPPRPASAERSFSAEEHAAYVETAIQQAVRRGEFDNLPGAGKPLPGLGSSHDPDWWLRRKIETEGLTGLGPPALTLRTEYAGLDARIDQWRSEAEVRDHLEDFNRRVIEARRQLLGGPPVVTPTVDVDERVREWNERRDAATRARSDVDVIATPRRRLPGWTRARRPR
ncbi:DUF1992 domain-containing protein [Microbacterium sp. P02]|uniref:DnaJ family domain-containing protein n=1 Tax=Microbacterium sp. P02 TaxID=3366260 RepID=UPI00366A9094